MWWKLYLLEYKRLIKNKYLLFLLFSFYLFYLLILLNITNLMSKLDMFINSNLYIIDYLKFPLCFSSAAWIASYFVPLWIIFLLIFLSYDKEKIANYPFSYRKKFFIRRLSFAFTIPFDWSLTTLLAGFIMWIRWGSIDIEQNFILILGLWIQLIAYVSFALLLISLFGSALKSVLAFFSYFVLEAIVRKLLFSFGSTIGFYLPAKVITSLVLPPAVDFVPVERYADFFSQHSLPFGINLLLACLYSIIFLLFFKYKTLKQ